MPSVSRYRTWLAVPADEIEDLKKAHPPMNGHTPVIWDKEHKLWFARPGADLSRLDRWLPRPQDVSMNGSDPVTEFAQVLENAGLVLKELPVMDGKIHRVPTADDKKGQKSGAYRGFLDGRPAGWYRDYRSADDSPVTWTFSGGEQTDPRARLHLKAHSMQRREDAERELKAQYNRQAAYARRYVNKWPQATAHEYLTRKGIQAAPGVRVNNKNELVIPFSNRNGAIRSYQRIPVTGGKDARILIDSEKTGNWFALGTPRNGQPVLFAEGYATAASLHEATGLPVLMTVDGGNMIAVAENARQKWTQSPFIFCADNDHAIRVNKGIVSATKAAELTGGTVIFPAFTDAEKAQGLTDFNDLDASRGRAAFQHVINAQLEHIGISTPNSNTPEIREALVIGNLVFTPVHTEEKNMTPTEYPETSPDTAHSSEHEPAPSLPPAPPEVQPSLSGNVHHEPVTTGEEMKQPESIADQDSPEAPTDNTQTSDVVPDTSGTTAELREGHEAVTMATAQDWQHFEEEMKQPENIAGHDADETSAEHTTFVSSADAPEPEPSATETASTEAAVSNDQAETTLTQQEKPDTAETSAEHTDATAAAPAEQTPSPSASEPALPEDTAGDEQLAAETSLQPDVPGAGDDGYPGYDVEYQDYSAEYEDYDASALQEYAAMQQAATMQHAEAEAGTETEQTTDVPLQQPQQPRTEPAQPQATSAAPGGTASPASEASDNSEPDVITYGPERKNHTRVRTDIDKLVRSLQTREQSDHTLQYHLPDGTHAFTDVGGHLLMAKGQSTQEQSILAALGVAMQYYGGVIELTGSDEFKKRTMEIIVDYDLKVTMKDPVQRNALEQMRAERENPDTIMTHMPTPELNRTTGQAMTQPEAPVPSQPAAVPPQQPAEAAASPTQDETPQPPAEASAPPVTPVPPATETQNAPAPTTSDNARMVPGKPVTGRLEASGRGTDPESNQMTDWIQLKTRSQTVTFWGDAFGKLTRDYKAGQMVTVTMASRNEAQCEWTMQSAGKATARISEEPQPGEQMKLFDAGTFRAAMEQICRVLPQWQDELKQLPLPSQDIALLDNGRPGTPTASSRCLPAPLPRNSLTMIAGGSNDNGLQAALFRTAGNYYQGVMRLGGHGLFPVLVTPVNQKLVVTAITKDGPRYAGYGNARTSSQDGTPVPPDTLSFTLAGNKTTLHVPLTAPRKLSADNFRLLGFPQTMQQWDQQQQAKKTQQAEMAAQHNPAPGR
ncbi:TPA: LPD7 domain-containing protein [Escherichia coli]|uniref:DNA primase n=6 Tax=Enterobacteriaceae TaxID=543 RepID=A0A7B9ZMB0_ECOLX|nr:MULTISPECIES: LPD7 domain-containing protein [Enterobacteriaceae]EEI6572235.1 DNA primase [Salmonella enterica subsp. enterica serovar 4,[5],12:i:-]EFO5863592.1 DNA primase [Salmonella enterica]EHC7493347.1 DNA primase [Salmonella enterica subsp. enterica serovar Typhimurium]EHF3199398.1 DNA primase [Salmonella enterica subsp. enterica serovar Newport]EHN6617980.1 DNA primase [Salmonella enterica subsp. enterica serovar Enteritidis]EKL9496591.1 DNA primase [Salmonella enterica subsp. enter